MFPSETIEALREWEERFPVHTWFQGDAPAWPLVRIMLGFRMLAASRPESASAARAVPKVRALEAMEIARSARAISRDPGKELLRLPRADLLFLSRPANRDRVGAAFHDRLFDPLAEALEARGRSSVQLEYHGQGTPYRLPRRRPSRLIRPAVAFAQARAVLAQRLRPRTPELPGWDQLVADLRHRCPKAEPPSVARIALRLRATHEIARMLGCAIDRVQPRAVLCVSWYSDVAMALCLAASRRGIPSVDLQHGVTAQNPAYEGWSRFPTGGYATVPDRFWCWRASDAQPVQAWGPDAEAHHRAFVGGHPWVAFWSTDRPETAPLLDRVRALRGHGLTVLVSLAWSSGLSDQLKQVLLAAPPDQTFWVRLHPLMDREREEIRTWCRDHLGDRALVDAPTDLPLPLLLREADVHLTHNSTVIQEAAACGVPSVTIDPRSIQTYAPEIASGWAVHEPDPSAVPGALRLQASRADDLPAGSAYPPASRLDEALDSLFAPT